MLPKATWEKNFCSATPRARGAPRPMRGALVSAPSRLASDLKPWRARRRCQGSPPPSAISGAAFSMPSVSSRMALSLAPGGGAAGSCSCRRALSSPSPMLVLPAGDSAPTLPPAKGAADQCLPGGRR